MWGEIGGGHHSRNWWVVHLDVNYVRAAMDFFDSLCIVKDQLYRMRSLKSGIALGWQWTFMSLQCPSRRESLFASGLESHGLCDLWWDLRKPCQFWPLEIGENNDIIPNLLERRHGWYVPRIKKKKIRTLEQRQASKFAVLTDTCHTT